MTFRGQGRLRGVKMNDDLKGVYKGYDKLL